MNKPKFETPDMTKKNIDKISQMFPNCITETKDENGKLKKAVNFELLQQMLSDEIADKDEAYEFTWVGKNAAIVEANKPIRKTLRPCKEESVNWDTTQNLYIEGDNLEVLKLLQESYLGKVKMIYIDPPYNTGNDFIYRDDFTSSSEEYAEDAGLFDDEGNRMFKNTDTNGRFHSDWCSMIYSRLLLARNLLSDDGVIFISIDDNEVENLKKICSEVFGCNNFIANIIWLKKYGIQNDAKYLSVSHDYLLLYSKNINNFKPNLLPRTSVQNDRYKNIDNDHRGPWKSADFTVPHYSENRQYEIELPSGRKVSPAKGRSWGASQEELKRLIADNRIWFGKNGDSIPCIKKFLSEVKDGVTATTFWHYDEVSHTDKAKKDLTKIMGDTIVFDYPKPIELIQKCLKIATSKDSIILDFFSGSATTAHSVMQLNADDNGNRKYILVQLPELTEEKTEAYKAGYQNICEIGKERIRRAGKKIKDDNPQTRQDLDIGFRVLKLDDSNMKDVYYSASEYDQGKLDMLESNIKEDRTDLDLLFGCLLDWGLQLSLPYTSETIGKFTVHTYNDGDLVACFNEDVSEEVVKEIARKKPLRAVFRDSSFSNSASKINVFEIFKMISPETSVKVI